MQFKKVCGYGPSRIGESVETENRLVVARGWWRREWEIAYICRGSFWSEENGLELVEMELPCEYTKNYGVVQFKILSFMVCALYLNKK